jgi:proteic killer suppression protein
MAIRSYRGAGTEHVAVGTNSREARSILPVPLHRIARRKLAQLDAAVSLRALGVQPGLRFEKLSGNRRGQFSIRVNDQYRICFKWKNNDAHEVEIVDYH